MKDFWDLVLHKCIVLFDAEQVNSKLKNTNFKIKEVTVTVNPDSPEQQIVEKL